MTDPLKRKPEEAGAREGPPSDPDPRREAARKRRDPVSLTRFGRVAQDLGRWDEAEEAYSDALRADGDFALAMENLGDLWLNRTDKRRDESLEVAKEWFLKALRVDRSPRTLVLLGAAYLARGDNAAAQAALEEALQLDPDNAEAVYDLALTFEPRDTGKAIRLVEAAIDLRPDYFLAHQTLGRLLHKSGDLAKAEYHFRRCLEIKPSDVRSLLYVANVLAVQGRVAEAEETYLQAAHVHPNDQNVVELAADFLDSIGKKKEASELRSRRSM